MAGMNYSMLNLGEEVNVSSEVQFPFMGPLPDLF